MPDQGRKTWLGFDYLRNKRNPNEGYMTVANSENSLPPVNQSTADKVLNIVKLVGLVLAGIASTLVAAAASGAAIPSAVLTVASVILAIATPLGIASPGIQPKPAGRIEKGPQP